MGNQTRKATEDPPAVLRRVPWLLAIVGCEDGDVVADEIKKLKDLLARHLHPNLAGKHQLDARRPGQKRTAQFGHRANHMLAIVEDQQQLLGVYRLDQGGDRAGSDRRPHPADALIGLNPGAPPCVWESFSLSSSSFSSLILR